MLVRAGGRERSGQFVSPQDRFSCWARRGKQLDTRNSGARTSLKYNGEILVHSLICPKQLYLKNMTFPKVYFILTLCQNEMLEFANRLNGLRCLFLSALHFSVDGNEQAETERVLWRIFELSLL